MRPALVAPLVAILLGSSAVAQDPVDKNKQVIQEVVAEIVEKVDERSGIANPRQREVVFDALAKVLNKDYPRVKINLEVTEVHPGPGVADGHVVVKPAAELQDDLPKDFLHTTKVNMKHLGEDSAGRIAVGDTVTIIGKLRFARNEFPIVNCFIIFGYYEDNGQRPKSHSLLICPSDMVISSSVDR